MSLHLIPALVCGVVGAALGVPAPRVVARIPELPPEPESSEPDETFAAVAARPGLAWKAATAAGVGAAVIGLRFGWVWPLLFLVPLVPLGVVLAVVDWRTRILPTFLIAPAYAGTVVLALLAWVGFGLQHEFVPRFLVQAAVGWLLAGGLYFALWLVYPRGMGYGDVRLSGLLGLALGFLGWSELVVGIYGGFLLGGVLGGLLALVRRVDRKGYPFGPFMLLGALVGVLFGQPIMDALVA